MTNKTAPENKKQEISNNFVPNRENSPYAPAPYNPVKGEMALWTAVITQALMDAGSQSAKPEAQHDKAKATRWLLGNSEDFVTVCLNAGLEPKVIRQKAMAAIERGCVWRQGMAEKRLRPSTPPPIHTKRIRPPLSRFPSLTFPYISRIPASVSGISAAALHSSRY
jgi:hypothetical protein